MLAEAFSYPFMVHALAAGTATAVTAGVLGWFVVLRREAFAAHTLGVVAFPGAAGGVLLGLPPVVGYAVACGAGAWLLTRPAGDAEARAARIGVLHAGALAAGLVFAGAYSGMLSQTTALLFGTFLGVSAAQVRLVVVVGVIVVGTVLVAWRPLLLASLDPDGAAARGIPVRALQTGLLGLLALAVAATSTVTGALLVFALLVLPAAAAHALTARPAAGAALAAGLAVGLTWVGLLLAFAADLPSGTTVTLGAFAVYVLAELWRRLRTAP